MSGNTEASGGGSLDDEVGSAELETRKNLVISARAAVAPGARAKIGVCGV